MQNFGPLALLSRFTQHLKNERSAKNYALLSQVQDIAKDYPIAIPGKVNYVISGLFGPREFEIEGELRIDGKLMTMLPKNPGDHCSSCGNNYALHKTGVIAGNFGHTKLEFVPEKTFMRQLEKEHNNGKLIDFVRHLYQERLPTTNLENAVVNTFKKYKSSDYNLSDERVQVTIDNIKLQDAKYEKTGLFLNYLIASLYNEAVQDHAIQDGAHKYASVASPSEGQLSLLANEVLLRNKVTPLLENTLKGISNKDPKVGPLVGQLVQTLKQEDPALVHTEHYIAEIESFIPLYEATRKVLHDAVGDATPSSLVGLNLLNQL